jgi:hypothetical protein
MPATYILISSNVLTGSAASVEFTSIPATYTDLVVRWSSRADNASAANVNWIELNSDTAANYSYTYLQGGGSAGVSSARGSAEAALYGGRQDAANATANTFGSAEMYIPSYTVIQKKPVSMDSTTEDNSTEAFRMATATLWQGTAAITSIKIRPNAGGQNFVTGSSFYLYGISNA